MRNDTIPATAKFVPKIAVVVKVVPKASYAVTECRQLQREFETLCFLHDQMSFGWRDHRRKSFNTETVGKDILSTRNPAEAIVKPIAFLETEDEVALVSERLDGPDLCQYLIGHKKGVSSVLRSLELDFTFV